MSPRRLWTAVAVVTVVGVLVVAGIVWFSRTERGVRLAGMPGDATATVTYAGSFPLQDRFRLRNPRGIILHGATLYVAEADAGIVRVYGLDGTPKGRIGVPKAPGAKVAYPVDLAFVGTDTLAIVDSAAPRVVLLPADPASKTQARVLGTVTRGTAPVRPTAAAVDGGRLLVADAADKRLKEYDATGAYKRAFGGDVVPPLTFVGGIAGSGRDLFVADSNAGRVLVFDPVTGRQTGTVPHRFGLPRGLDADTRGEAFVADVFGRDVTWYLDGRLRGGIGAGFTEVGETLREPQDAVLDQTSSRLYVTDSGSGVVRVYNLRRGS